MYDFVTVKVNVQSGPRKPLACSSSIKVFQLRSETLHWMIFKEFRHGLRLSWSNAFGCAKLPESGGGTFASVAALYLLS